MDEKLKAKREKRGRNLSKEEVDDFMKEFARTIASIKISKKPFVISANKKLFQTNPELPIEEIQKILDIKDESKVDFLRQLYIRGGQSIINKLWPDENIVNLPTVSFTEEGNTIRLNY
jgi:hypothetical protein